MERHVLWQRVVSRSLRFLVTLVILGSLAGSGCTAAVNGIGGGKYPRIQAVVLLAGATFQGALAISAGLAAAEGKTVCRPDPDGGGGSLSGGSSGLSNDTDCTYPIEYAIAAAIFGSLATFDTGVAIYQLVSGKQATQRPHKFAPIDPALYPSGHPKALKPLPPVATFDAPTGTAVTPAEPVRSP